jgi:hypothetical protein
MVNTTGTRMSACAAWYKCMRIFGASGAISTAPRMGRQVPSRSKSRCGGPA